MTKVDMTFGTTIGKNEHKALSVGPLFPRINRKAAKLATEATKLRQKQQGRILYDDMKTIAEQATNKGKALKSFVKKVQKKSK